MATKKTTRREFLKTSAVIAGTAIIPGCSIGQAVQREPEWSAPEESKPNANGRAGYKVFSEGSIGGMRVKNRLVRSATMSSAASEGVPSVTYKEMHATLAKGGVGILITGFMLPSKGDLYAYNPKQIRVYDDQHIQGLKEVADLVHATDSQCRLVAQIGHSGEAVSPSGINWPHRRQVRQLSTQEVEAIANDTAHAIRRVREAGFDGAEIHGAHGYLVSSFLSPFTNKRTDKYGGSLQNRVRMVSEIVEQARDRVGSGFPILIKLNSEEPVPGGITPATFPDLAEEIEKTGVDAIDVSGSDCIKPDIDTIEEETYFLRGARAAEVDIPIILTGGNRTIDHMEALLKQNGIDFFGLSRPLIREPDLPNRWLAGRGDASATCISCNECLGVISRGEPVYCVQDA